HRGTRAPAALVDASKTEAIYCWDDTRNRRENELMKLSRRRVDRIDELARFGGVEHRRLAAPHDMARPTHGSRRFSRHDLPDYHPIEQVTQGGQAQLGGHVAPQRLSSDDRARGLSAPRARF